ncbi:MAG: hypothetical protein HYZ17_02320 [Betaproteobacteria bacterium]|nr:hypothetical protein [Betaproteobacteria bacterium]
MQQTNKGNNKEQQQKQQSEQRGRGRIECAFREKDTAGATASLFGIWPGLDKPKASINAVKQ